MKPDDAKTVYQHYYNQQYKAFVLGKHNIGESLTLAKKGWGWMAASKDVDTFTKKEIPKTHGKLQVIKKNKQVQGILWKTTPEKLRQGLRWGIVKAESITGQVLATLGRYRITAHERVIRGMTSNMQALKLQLLDVHQDKIEALMDLESLVNKRASYDDYKNAMTSYTQKLGRMKAQLARKFSQLQLKRLEFSDLVTRLEDDIDSDIERAEEYLYSLKKEKAVHYANRARGTVSIIEFVKQTMHDTLYALQGLNQDAVFSIGTLTRGELNNVIEDARYLIDNHQPDLRNAITAKHHLHYDANQHKEIVYDFSADGLSPDDERKTLVAISFIEEWDKVDYVSDWSSPKVANKNKDIGNLTKISATKWLVHPRPVHYLWEYAKNWFKGLIFPTTPWEDDVFEGFSLFSHYLLSYARPDDPLWLKTWHFLKKIKNRLWDVVKGVYNFGCDFTLSIPKDLINDWEASKKMPCLTDTLKLASVEARFIAEKEEKILGRVLKKVHQQDLNRLPKGEEHRLASVDYHLTAGEQQDTITALTQALGSFVGHFTHQVYSKDPVGSLLFTAAFAAGGFSVLFPGVAKTIFLKSYVSGFNDFAKLVGSSPISEALCGGLMQAQAAHLVWNAALEGPSSDLIHVARSLLDNPVPNAFGFAAAYGLGYALANIPIPHFHEFIKEELGSSEILNYPVIGIKFGVGLIMLVLSGKAGEYLGIDIPYDGHEFQKIKRTRLNSSDMYNMGLICQQFNLVQWLNAHASVLPKLSTKIKAQLNRQIDLFFEQHPERAISLKKLIYPEKTYSIAYQFFAVPLGYIPAVIRVFLSFFVSLFAWLNDNKIAHAPIKNATEALLRKAAKDCNRLFIACMNMVYIAANVLATPFKVVGFTLNLLVGRLAAFVDMHPGHLLHQGFAAIHRGYRWLAAFLTPVRAMKSVVFADPVHTIQEVTNTYESVLGQLGALSTTKSRSPNQVQDKMDLRRRIHFHKGDSPKPPLFVESISVGSSQGESDTASPDTLSEGYNVIS